MKIKIFQSSVLTKYDDLIMYKAVLYIIHIVEALGNSKNTSKAEVVLLVAGVASAVGGAERMATAVATGPASEAALESLMGTALWEVVAFSIMIIWVPLAPVELPTKC
jgi:hypothetical protein